MLTCGPSDGSRTKKPMLRILLHVLGFLPAPWLARREHSKPVIPRFIVWYSHWVKCMCWLIGCHVHTEPRWRKCGSTMFERFHGLFRTLRHTILLTSHRMMRSINSDFQKAAIKQVWVTHLFHLADEDSFQEYYVSDIPKHDCKTICTEFLYLVLFMMFTFLFSPNFVFPLRLPTGLAMPLSS